MIRSKNNFATYAWCVLVYNIAVILWGAFVRATGSGAGCGNHWPSCNGEIVPLNPQTATLIEYTHRLTSGLSLLLIILLLVWALRIYPKGHLVRLGAKLSMFFIITEALVGAGLVLFELVAYNTTSTRAMVVAIHLVNTFILLAVLTLTAWWASRDDSARWRGQGWPVWMLWGGFVGILLVGASGAIIALGDTLFPAASLAEGLQQKLSPTAHFLIRLRPYHPIIAIGVGIYLILAAGIFNTLTPTPASRSISRLLTGLYFVQLAAGAVNIVLLVPIWMQLIHLLLSDFILISWAIFMDVAFASEIAQTKIGSQKVSQSGKGVYG